VIEHVEAVIAPPTFEEVYSQKLEIVQAGVADLAELVRAEASQHGPYIDASTEAYLSILEGGGKRTRGVLAVAGYELWGGDANDGVIGLAAAAIEGIQTYALVFDDAADRSDTRRGQPAAHIRMTAYLQDLASPEDAVHLGQHIAMNEALTNQHRVQRLLARLPASADRRLLAIDVLNDLMVLTGIGQQLDMFSTVRSDTTTEDARKIAQLKTAYYSVLMPLQIGAALAGAPAHELPSLEEYAVPAGYAFQMRDDILGTFGVEGEMGKSNKTDLMEGKRTVLYLTAYEAATESQRHVLQTALGNTALSDEHLAECQEIMRVTGVYDSMVVYAESYAQQAANNIGYLADERPMKHIQFLQQMALYGARRSK